jgi:hypothetical protein
MHAWKHPLVSKFLLLSVLASLLSEQVRAQVMVDVSKIPGNTSTTTESSSRKLWRAQTRRKPSKLPQRLEAAVIMDGE